MRVALRLLLGVLLLFATAAIVSATQDCTLTVFKDGCYYPDTCVRKWGDCPDLDISNCNLELATDQRCIPSCVGFGVFANCPVDLSDYNVLLLGAELCLEGGVEKCALYVKVELEDEECHKCAVYFWIVPKCNDYVIVLKAFKSLNFCKITGLFLLTAFDIISYEECIEAVLVIPYIKFASQPYYSVFDECTSYQYEAKYFGPNSLYYWPCLPCPVILSNCDGHRRVLSIPCNTWGAGFCGFCQDLSGFKYLSFYLKSSVNIKVEVGDGNCCKAAYCVDSTCDKWRCVKIPLCDLTGIDLCNISWQFMATKLECCDSEVKIASIRYLYC